VRLLISEKHSLLRACVAGAVVQACVVVVHYQLNKLHIGTMGGQAPLSVLMKSVPANGFGALLLQLILNEARTRADGERHRLDAERSQAMVAEAQLMSLRARVHPHFLFNTLTSIAALCSIAPDRAEDAIVRLSQLMRRVLETAPATQQPLGDELEYVQSYLQIEQHRLGDRLQVLWEIQPGTDSVQVPPFSVQILVENSINHGVCPRMEPGTIRVVVRAHGNHILVAVADDGAGMDSLARSRALDTRDSREHGLQTLTQQLTLLYGESSRIRVFSRPDSGTIACFCLPAANNVGNARGSGALIKQPAFQESIA
jgi:sensor histidine kinase YesM